MREKERPKLFISRPSRKGGTRGAESAWFFLRVRQDLRIIRIFLFFPFPDEKEKETCPHKYS